ncbi:MAG TPA: hypothetical protein VN476_04210 [Pyrinomonadaceae bacterium]|nr:hypothetical protein [Pyrinomonadaceae bacterium]
MRRILCLITKVRKGEKPFTQDALHDFNISFTPGLSPVTSGRKKFDSYGGQSPG